MLQVYCLVYNVLVRKKVATRSGAVGHIIQEYPLGDHHHGVLFDSQNCFEFFLENLTMCCRTSIEVLFRKVTANEGV